MGCLPIERPGDPVCMLTYLEIENKKIAGLIQTSTSVVSNAKKKANRKCMIALMLIPCIRICRGNKRKANAPI